MFQGRSPFFTKGPLALFYGGKDILSELSDEQPGDGLHNLLLISIIFQLSMYLYEKYRKRQLQKVADYLRNLRASTVKNILNVYGVVLLIIFNILAFLFLVSHNLRIGQQAELDKEDNLVPDGIYVLTLLFLTIVLWPYRSHALR